MRQFYKLLITLLRYSAEKGRKIRNKKKEELKNVASCGTGTCPINNIMMKMPFGQSIRYVRHSFRLFFIFTAWIFEKTFRWKVMARKANMQMGSYRSRPVLARFEYRAYISRYLQAAH